MPAELWVLGADGYWTTVGRRVSARDGLAYGTYRPGPDTTGITIAREDLEVVTGNYFTQAPNEVHEGKWFKGKFTRKHDGGVLRNCLITGDTAGPSSPSYSAISAYDAFPNPLIIEDCTIEASVPTVYSSNGIMGRDIEIYRTEILGWVDAIGLFRGKGKVKGNWIHGSPWYSWSPNHSDGSHNDGIQIHGGSDYEIVGNSFEVGYKATSGIIVTQDDGITSDVLIDRNWIESTWIAQAEAGAVAINVSASGSGGAAMSGIVITNNQLSVFGKWKSNHAVLINPATYDGDVVRSGNVVIGTNTPAKITRG